MSGTDEGRFEGIREDLLERLSSLSGFEDLLAVWLFGSQARGEAREGSDVDVACSYELPREQLGEISVQLAGRLPARYDAEVFQLLPLPVRRRVLGGELLWTRDEDRVYDVAYNTIRAWEDFRPRYEMVIE